MASGNDAAYALARVGGGAGGVPQTLRRDERPRRAARRLRHRGPRPRRAGPAGADSSAYDLALIGRAAMQLPDLRRYVTTKHVSFPGGRGPDGKARRAFIINNHNRLLYNYPGTIGIKNGYTVAAEADLHRRRLPRRPHLPVTEMAGTNAQLAPHRGPAGLGLRPRRRPGTGGPARAAGQRAAARRRGRRRRPRRSPAGAPARAPDPAAGGDAAAPGEARPRAAALRVAGATPRRPGWGSAAPQSPPRRCWAAASPGDGPACAGGSSPPPQISSFCLICPLSHANRLGYAATPTRDRAARLITHSAPWPAPDRRARFTRASRRHTRDDPGPLTVAARSDPLLSGPSP